MSNAAILVMWPQDQLKQISFPHPMETLYEIWLKLAQWFLRRRRLKSVDDGRQMPTYPISSGELKMILNLLVHQKPFYSLTLIHTYIALNWLITVSCIQSIYMYM